MPCLLEGGDGERGSGGRGTSSLGVPDHLMQASSPPRLCHLLRGRKQERQFPRHPPPHQRHPPGRGGGGGHPIYLIRTGLPSDPLNSPCSPHRR